jgi:single-strand DNA-binding protein
MTYQSITIVGHLGRDPEMRYTPKGDAVTDFSIAASRRKDDTVWFKVSVWGAQAEACNQYLHKGSKALVVGRLVAGDDGNPKTFTRKDGTTGSSFEISAYEVKFLDSKEEPDISF